MTLLWKHICNGKSRQWINNKSDRQTEGERERESESNIIQVHALLNAITCMRWTLNEFKMMKGTHYIRNTYIHICIWIYYIERNIFLTRAQLWHFFFFGFFALALFSRAPGEKKRNNNCNETTAAAAALTLMRYFTLSHSFALPLALSLVAALVPAALLFSKRHWGFGIEPTHGTASCSLSHVSWVHCSLSFCVRVCVCVRLSMRFPLLVCLIAFGNYYYWCCCCCFWLVGLSAQKVSQMSCLEPATDRCRGTARSPGGPSHCLCLWFDSSHLGVYVCVLLLLLSWALLLAGVELYSLIKYSF